MYEKPEILTLAFAAARHAAARQSVIATNIANADTPGYRAEDVAPFDDVYAASSDMRATRPGHLTDGAARQGVTTVLRGDAANMSPNGNDVSLESEMVNAAAAREQHATALAVYRSAMDVLRTSLGRK